MAGSWASTVYFNGAGNLLSAGNLFGRLTCAQAVTLSDNLSFIADQQCALVSAGNALNVNGKTISGNSVTNRLLIRSDTIGTPRTVTVAGGSFANCDFRDIAFNNGGNNLDLSAITGGSGDCGGNSMSGGGVLTFTAPSTQTFASTGGNWSDVAKWTSRVPLPQDLARTQPMSEGQTITVDMPRLPDTSFAGCGSTNLPSVNLTTTGLTYEIYGSLNLTGVATGGWSCNKAFSFHGRSNASLTSNGQTFATNAAVAIYKPGVTLSFADAYMTSGGTSYLYLYNGTFTTNYNITTAVFHSYTGTFFSMGAGIWMLRSTGNVFWIQGTCLDAGTSTIVFTYQGVTPCNFFGGTNTYNDITIAPGSGVLTFSGAFTFRNMTMSSSGTRSIVFTKGTTYTMTGDSFLNGAGVDDAPIISPTLLNGGFETAGAGGADVFANWAENVSGTSTVTDDTTTPHSGGHACKLTCDASGSGVNVSISGILTAGRLYKVELWAKSPTSSTLQISLGTLFYEPIATEWTKYTFYVLATGAHFMLRGGYANAVFHLDDVTLTPLNSVLIQSSGAGEPFTLSKANGLIASNYLAIKDSIATGGAIWLAGYNSTNISGNTGWHFNSPASGAGVIPITAIATSAALATGDPQDAQFTITSPTTSSKALATGIPEPATFTFASPTLAAMAKAYTAALSATINFTSSAIAKVLANATPQSASFTFIASSPLAAKALAIANQINASFSFIGSFIPTITVWQLSNFKSAFNRRLGIFKSAHKRR